MGLPKSDSAGEIKHWIFWAALGRALRFSSELSELLFVKTTTLSPIVIFFSDGAPPRFVEFVNRHEDVLQALVARFDFYLLPVTSSFECPNFCIWKTLTATFYFRNPKILFSHFHFLLDSPVLMQKFVHVVLAQVTQLNMLEKLMLYDNNDIIIV